MNTLYTIQLDADLANITTSQTFKFTPKKQGVFYPEKTFFVNNLAIAEGQFPLNSPDMYLSITQGGVTKMLKKWGTSSPVAYGEALPAGSQVFLGPAAGVPTVLDPIEVDPSTTINMGINAVNTGGAPTKCPIKLLLFFDQDLG